MFGWMGNAPCHLTLKDFGIVEGMRIERRFAIPRIIEVGWVRAMNDLVAESCGQIRGVKLFVVVERGNAILESRAVKLFHCALFYLLAAGCFINAMVCADGTRLPVSQRHTVM